MLAVTCGAVAQGEKGTVQFDFQDAKLRAVIEAVAKSTGRNFLVDPRVKGKVTVVGPSRLTTEEAYEVFQSVLAVNGFVTVEGDGVTKIVPKEEGKQRSLPLSEGEEEGDQMVTRVLRVEHVPAQRMVPVLRPLLPSHGHLVAYSDTNALIITDHAENVQRLTNIVRRLDRPGESGEVEVVPLVHASAEEMAEILGQLYQGKKGQDDGGTELSVLSDPRTNNLIIKGSKATREEIKKLAEQLDSPTGSGGNVRVMYLENADAETLVEILEQVIAKQAEEQGKSSGRDDVAIHADKQTNAVVIRASKSAFQTIEKVVDRLDIRRLQVYVEALIAEVASTRASEFGIQWQATDGLKGDNRGAVGGTSFNIGTDIQDVAQNPSAAGSGLSVGYVNGSIDLGGEAGEVLSLGGLVRALETDTNSNVLSTPNLLTMDNQEAEIVVGQNVPFVTGSYSQTGSNNDNATNPFQTIERKDVGLTLRLTPQITEGSSVKMDIYQEVSSVTRQASNAADIITNKRSLDTTVVAENGEMIVLGGLIKTDRNKQQQMVPILGRIPLLGNLFRYETVENQKTNLMVFLRPKIIRKNADMADPTSDKYQFLNELRDEQFGEKKEEEPPPLEQWERIGPDAGAPRREPEESPERDEGKTPEEGS